MQWHGSGGLATVRPLFLCGWWKYKLNYRQLCAVPPREANPLLAKCHEARPCKITLPRERGKFNLKGSNFDSDSD